MKFKPFTMYIEDEHFLYSVRVLSISLEEFLFTLASFVSCYQNVLDMTLLHCMDETTTTPSGKHTILVAHVLDICSE